MLHAKKKNPITSLKQTHLFFWHKECRSYQLHFWLSVLLSVLILTGLFFSFNIKSTTPQKTAKISASSFLVSELPQELESVIMEQLPFLDRWDPLLSNKSQKEIESQLLTLLSKPHKKKQQWLPYSKEKERLSSPPLAKELNSFHPSIYYNQPLKDEVAPQNLKPYIAARANNPTLQIIRSSQSSLTIDPSWHSSTIDFFIGVNKSGEVLYATPTTAESSSLTSFLEEWIRSQRFKPSSEDTYTKISLSIELKS